MMYELKDDYRKKVLLSSFNLENNVFDDNWITNFFEYPLSNGINVFNKNGEWNTQPVYISWGRVTISKELPKSEFYKAIHKEMRKYISKELVTLKSNIHVYSYYAVQSKTEKSTDFLFIYLSPNKKIDQFPISEIKNKDFLIKNTFEMLLKAYILEQENEDYLMPLDVYSGNLFLNPQVRKNNKVVSLYSYKLNYHNFKLSPVLKNELFSLDENNDISMFDNVCSANNFKYHKKLDARKNLRLFLDFSSYENMGKTKYITQRILFEKIEGMLKKYKISFENERFEPTHVFNNFLMKDLHVEKMTLCISDIDEKILNQNVPNGLNELVRLIELRSYSKINILVNPSLEKMRSIDEPYIFVMYSDEEISLYVKEILSDKKNEWTSVITPYMERNYGVMSENDFLNEIKNFDTYSQVKLYNLYASMNNKKPIISQGMIIDAQILLKPINDSGAKPKEYPSKALISKIDNITTEINYKFLVYKSKNITFNFDFESKSLKINKIEIIQKLSKESGVIYSYLKLERHLNVLNVIDYKTFLEEGLSSLNLEIDIKNDFLKSDNLMLINDEYLLKIKDNENLPYLVIQEDVYKTKDDPLKIIKESIINGNSKGNSFPKGVRLKVSNDKEKLLILFPYTLPGLKVITKVGLKSETEKASCLIEVKDKNMNIFMHLSKNSINATQPKNVRIESLELYHLEDFEFKKKNVKDYMEIMEFYLSSLTYNSLIINSASKKSVLNKLTDILLVN